VLAAADTVVGPAATGLCVAVILVQPPKAPAVTVLEVLKQNVTAVEAPLAVTEPFNVAEVCVTKEAALVVAVGGPTSTALALVAAAAEPYWLVSVTETVIVFA
jgi:hypothetical protein